MKRNEIEGQISIETPKPTITPIKPTKPSAGTVAPSETSQTVKPTPEKASEETRKRFEQRQQEERERIERRKRENPPPNFPPVEKADDGAEESDGEDFETVPKKPKRRRICKKYGIKDKELSKAIDEARKLFVPKMGATCAPKLLVAIIELLEYGDI